MKQWQVYQAICLGNFVIAARHKIGTLKTKAGESMTKQRRRDLGTEYGTLLPHFYIP